ncbi:MAG: adenosylcobyric acid synthase [Bryobacterales bacterium]|nr:adenosylcobyric acid synthase [Bryobacterales bacterium]
MVAGTASNVGKSWMTTAICRWLVRQGYSVAPFKAQNMSNNSYPCAGGGEIGRAQVAQAEACFLESEPDMNPILLKPNSDTGSQVVVNGKVWRNLPAREYYGQFPWLLDQVLAAYHRLAAKHDFVVLEGAGSISELNLKPTDLVNLGLATRLNVPVLLVADIDRGGIFASIVGTFALLDENERSLVRSFAVNRFRGDPALFETGVDLLETHTGKPCMGVFPYLHDAPLDPEDGVDFDGVGEADSDIGIIALPHISNISDFRLIPHARRIQRPIDAHLPCVMIPGTKNTLGDLAWLRKTGLADWILDQHRQGAKIIGICGGYQIMGDRIDDPLAMESAHGSAEGLGLLPVRTVLAAEKTTRRVSARTPSGIEFDAYEIHLGVTTARGDPFATLRDGTPDGIRTATCTGTYLHGALENPQVLGELLGRTIAPLPSRESTYEALADWFEANVNRKRFEELYLCS